MRSQSIAGLLVLFVASLIARGAVPDLSGVAQDSAIKVAASVDSLTLNWPAGGGTATLRIATGEKLSFSASLAGADKPIFENAVPVYTLRVGQRDLKPNGWTIFFDRVDERPYLTLPMNFSATAVKAVSTPTRATVTLGPVTAGDGEGAFEGVLELTVIAGSPLVQIEAVVSTKQGSRAILYDACLQLPRGQIRQVGFEDFAGKLTAVPPEALATGPVRTHLRTLAADTNTGSIAVFPPPHQYFYPTDFANNFGFNDYVATADSVRIGMRQPPHGDGRFRPWVNCPPDTKQRLCMFLLLSDGPMAKAIDSVRAFTRDDRVPVVAGHKAMVSHLHVEHTAEFLRQQRENADPDAVPWPLVDPGWVQLLKARGIQIAHLAEFHFGDTPQRDAARRIKELKTLHAEAARLSNDAFLVVPGEEPNVHLGGHWISLFPKPVYWVLKRGKDEPFVAEHDGVTLYRVGSAADVLELMEREHGLLWTAHPRIKSSQGFPDAYLATPFFQSDHFLGGAWKAMPADYSLDRLGARVLDLQDDLANKGFRKPILGEIDLFQLDPTFEFYGHMNVNYLELETIPGFADGWAPVLDCLKAGKFFTTTGEVIIENTRISGAAPGQVITALGATTVTARVTFTFPPAFAEIVSGDGTKTYRDRVDLSGWPAFTTGEISVPINLTGRTWARLEVWDIARNGAFTPPVWIGR